MYVNMQAVNYGQLLSAIIVSLRFRPLMAPSIASKNNCVITIHNLQSQLPPGRCIRKRTNDLLHLERIMIKFKFIGVLIYV